MTTRRAIVGVSLVVAGALSWTVLAKPASELKAWVQGPVRYIALPAEMDLYKRLETDPERASFVEGFWQRRDPSEGTLVNEYRQLFWRRVQEANERFVEGPAPGWKTDRGKIHILYGAPSRIESDPYFTATDNPIASRGVIRWIYEQRPGGRMDLGPTVVVPFERDVTGAYRLSSDPTLASEFYDLKSIEDRSYYKRWLDIDIVQASRSQLAIMADLGKMQEVPSQEQLLIEQVETFESYAAKPLSIATQRYRDPDGDDVILTLSASLPGTGEDRPAIVARVRDQLGEERLLGDGSFAFEGDGAERQAQARLRVAPGDYDLTVLAIFPDRGQTLVYRDSLTVGDVAPGGRLGLSDLALVRQLEPVPYATLASYDEPFVVGHFNVIPRFGNTLPRGEALVLFYEVYGGTLPLKITYRLEGREDDGSWTSLGVPAVQEGGKGAQGWSVPTNPRWPVGDYRVRVLVEDGAGAHAESDLDFKIVSSESS